MRTAVVLPAPLGPSRPSTVPCGICRSMPSSALVDPKVFTRPSASTANADPTASSMGTLDRCDGIRRHRQKARGFPPGLPHGSARNAAAGTMGS